MASPVYIYTLINKSFCLSHSLSISGPSKPKLCGPWRSSTTLHSAQSSPLSYFLSFFLSHFYTVNALFCIIFPCSVSVSVRIFHFSPLLFWWSGVLTRGRLDLCQLPSHYRHRTNHDAGVCVSLCPNSNLVLGFWCPLPDNYYCMWPIHAKTNIQVAWVLLYMIGTTLSSMKFSK